jgi:hypothetical protein
MKKIDELKTPPGSSRWYRALGAKHVKIRSR